ncbi:trehalose transport system permease protein SugB [Peptococcaceae bacterium CEB3]|nr:trehalose transport system permease protein SugB [Peptococcaceae bacterium CEB3]
MNSKSKNNIFLQIVLWLIILAFTVPTLWLFLTSIKTRVDAFAMPPKWIFKPVVSNYLTVLHNKSFMHYYLNSVMVAIATTALGLLLGVPAGYALSRYNFKKKDDLAFWILSTRMAPPILVIVPFYLLFRRIHLLDTLAGLVLVYATFSLAFVTWMMKGYFDGLPRDLEEASRVDGATRLRCIVSVILPLSGPGLMASAIFTFISSWNEYFYALILTGTRSQTVPVAINSFITFEGIRWGEISAAGILILVPVVIFGLLVQKYLVSGLTMGAVK